MDRRLDRKPDRGMVTVSVDRGMLRLNLPRHLYGGKRKYLYLHLPDTPTNRRAAEAKAKLIDADIAFERFDHTLEKYGKQPTHLTVIQSIKPEALTVLDLWQRFAADKLPGLKPKTCEKYRHFTRLFSKLDGLRIDEPLAVKNRLMEVTTLSRTKDALTYINAACKWGLKYRLIDDNPFDGLAADLPQHRYQTDPQPNAFTEEERDRVIAAFHSDVRKGMNYRHYASFVLFLFHTGCRPSEAIGLTWRCVSEDCSSVTFRGSLVQVGNQRVWSDGSKNNRIRKVGVNATVTEMLQAIRPEECDPDNLVFPSHDGDSINYRNFARRAWRAVVDPIKSGTTPYNARDSFITCQLIKGIPSSVIAKWCDTSTQMIDKNYGDKLKLTALKPMN